MGVKERLDEAVGGYPLGPLTILFGLNFVDEFDRIAFATLTPEIRDAFDLTDPEIGTISIVVAVFVLIAALPIGVLADRRQRVRIAGAAAVLWGAMSVLTGIVPTVALLILVRLGSGMGRVINEVVHPSLLADYYKPESHPRVFQIHRMANPTSAVMGIAAGVVGGALGYRAAFIILALPTFALLLALSRLKEPKRGATLGDLPDELPEELALALAETEATTGDEDEAEGKLIKFGEARRQLFAIRTLKRSWLAGFFLGVAGISLATILTLFFEQVYDFGAVGRGTMQTVFGAGTVVGLALGAKYAGQAFAHGRISEIARINAAGLGILALGSILLGLSPWAFGSVIFAFVLSVGNGMWQPAFFSLVGLVAPPKLRSQAYAFGVLSVGAGGTFGIFLFGIGDSSGYRTATVVMGAILFIGAAIALSAGKFMDGDVIAARRSLEAQAKAKADGADGAILSTRGVEVAYDQVQVLFGVDMDVMPGEIVALLGTNGAGKSTLLKAICGIVQPIGGTVMFEGNDITRYDAVQCAEAGLVQVPGGKAVFPTLTVAEHLRAAGWLYKDDQEYLKLANEDVLETFPRLRERYDQMAGNLSGGEQQMLALGMAFIAKPKILMIDELSLGLAPTIVEQLLGIVRRIQESGTAIILVEQSINVALTVAERAYFLEKGEVRFEGPTAELMKRDDIVRSVFLQGASQDNEGGVSIGGGSEADDEVTGPRSFEGPTVLELNDVSKSFGGIRAVNGTSFHLHPGEILGLIGPNGAGKTTIFDLISGFLIPTSGLITFDGVDVTKMSPDQRAWLGLGRSFQDARLVGSLTVAENLAIGLERFIETRDHVAATLSLPDVLRLEEDVAYSVEDLVELMHLGAYRDKFVRELSTGSRRIVDLAMCIAHDPKVLLLDEPSSGIAQREAEALGPLLRRIQRETGCALLVIEHDMPLITGVSDRMIALELGTPIAEGTPDEVISEPRVVSSYLGGDMATINRSGTNPDPVADDAAEAADESELVSAGSGMPPRRRRRPVDGSGRPRPPGVEVGGADRPRRPRREPLLTDQPAPQRPRRPSAAGNGDSAAAETRRSRPAGNGSGNGADTPTGSVPPASRRRRPPADAAATPPAPAAPNAPTAPPRRPRRRPLQADET